MKNTDGATATFKTLVAAQPEWSLAHRYLAQAYAASGKIDLGLEEARKAVALDPRDAAAKSVLARAYLPTRDFAEAQKLADELAIEHPEDPAAADLQGQIALAKGHPEDAVTAFRRSMTLADNGLTRARLARALVLVGRADGAEAILSSWIAAHPDDAVARLSLGDLCLAAHRLDEAAVQYAAVSERYPDNVAAHNNLAWILSLKGSQTEALAQARRAADLAPNAPEVLDTLGVVLMQNQRMPDAVAALQGAAAGAPANLEIQLHFAQALAGVGNNDKARDILRMLVATTQPFNEREQAEKLLAALGS
jgi:predicted Zn-dependent protease